MDCFKAVGDNVTKIHQLFTELGDTRLTARGHRPVHNVLELGVVDHLKALEDDVAEICQFLVKAVNIVNVGLSVVVEVAGGHQHLSSGLELVDCCKAIRDGAAEVSQFLAEIVDIVNISLIADALRFLGCIIMASSEQGLEVNDGIMDSIGIAINTNSDITDSIKLSRHGWEGSISNIREVALNGCQQAVGTFSMALMSIFSIVISVCLLAAGFILVWEGIHHVSLSFIDEIALGNVAVEVLEIFDFQTFIKDKAPVHS